MIYRKQTIALFHSNLLSCMNGWSAFKISSNTITSVSSPKFNGNVPVVSSCWILTKWISLHIDKADVIIDEKEEIEKKKKIPIFMIVLLINQQNKFINQPSNVQIIDIVLKIDFNISETRRIFILCSLLLLCFIEFLESDQGHYTANSNNNNNKTRIWNLLKKLWKTLKKLNLISAEKRLFNWIVFFLAIILCVPIWMTMHREE